MSNVLLLHGVATIGLSLSEVIAAAPGLQMQAVAGSVAQAREAMARQTPDLLVADLLQPGGNLLALLQGLQGLRSGAGDGAPQVLVLCASADDPRLVDAIRHGADGYFMPGRPASLIATIEQVLRGESTMTPQIARELMLHFDSHAEGSPLRLSERDRLLLQWTAEGFLVNEVARGLQLDAREVGLRMRSVYRKLQFDVRVQRLALLAA
jgi:DNA-binding NarL/FixJ family response regulator